VQQVSRTPDAVAVVAGERQLTYRELEARSNQLARYLRSQGVRPETLVGVATERSEELVICLLGILKAGGAYVPLDPAHPAARLALVIEDAELATILTSRRLRDRLPAADNRLVVLETAAPEIAACGAEPLEGSATPETLAYVIYTSGSTGKPKGVMVEQRNVVSFFSAMDAVIGAPDGGVWLAVTSVSFDISVLELLWTLTRGFKVSIHGDEGAQTIPNEILRYGVTHLQMTPSLARMLTMDPRSLVPFRNLRQLLLGGETLPASLVAKLRREYRGEIVNMYGPTETTVWSTTHLVEAETGSIPIGRPIANTQLYILNERFEPVPMGEPGELFIGGEGVVRGYWKRPDLTAQRFLANPFRPGGRIYRTGDLARCMPDGNAEFLGRADFQIKLRGFRIEPGEIEAALEQAPGVKQAVVVAREDSRGDKRLLAYLTAIGAENVSAETLRSALASRLPDYMIPSGFIFLDSLPLTDNLKIDRSALLRLPPPNQAPGDDANPLQSTMERTIAEAWQEALGVETVGREDNFFDLGAHSLTVAEVHGKLQEMLGREFPFLDLFQFPTVRALAANLGRSPAQQAASDRARRRLAARAR
jgi:amino acid adenylation domain-containing protein